MTDEVGRARERRNSREQKTLALLLLEHNNNSLVNTEAGLTLALYIAPPGGCPHGGKLNIAHCECKRHEFIGVTMEELMHKTLDGLAQILGGG